MITCNYCGGLMVNALSFSKDKNEKYSKCPKCYSETKRRAIKPEDLNFGEILQKHINKK